MKSLANVWQGIYLLLIINLFLSGAHAYYYWPNLDLFMHTAGGFLLAAWGWQACGLRNYPWQIASLTMIGISLSVGWAYEVLEFMGDAFYGAGSKSLVPLQVGLGDTLLDFACDLLGAVVAFIFYSTRIASPYESPLK